MANVTFTGVSKSFGSVQAISNLSIDIADGEFVVLLGPTGAGKTTTLRLAAGLEKPDSGSILIDGADYTASEPSQRNVAFVFQQYSLYPHLTVFDNLAFPLRSPLRRLPDREIEEKVRHTAELLRIGHKMKNKSTQLSGGEMQRVAIGRALVRNPSIYLMDEPLSSLDAKLRADLRLELKRIQRDLGSTILYVTHDQIEAMTMADRVGILSEGGLVQIGTPREIYTDPDNVYVAARLGQPSINVLPIAAVKPEHAPKGAYSVGARTEHVRLSKAGKGAANATPANGTLDWVEHLGDQNHMHVRLGDHRLTMLADPRSDLVAGDDLIVQFDAPLYFDEDGRRIR